MMRIGFITYVLYSRLELRNWLQKDSYFVLHHAWAGAGNFGCCQIRPDLDGVLPAIVRLYDFDAGTRTPRDAEIGTIGYMA